MSKPAYKLTDPQRRLLVAMIGAPLQNTSQGWFAKGHRAHATSARHRLAELKLIQPVQSIDLAYELTEEGFQEAIRS